MLDPSLALIRNIGIIAHIDAGKTTLSERFLYYSGKTHRIGDIDSGTTVMDYLDEERSRGITIVSAAASFPWLRHGRTHLFHLIDTPGHIDFTAEVERSLRVIDGAVVIFSGVEGVEAQSEKVWRQADRYHVPKIAFVNKLDRMGASFERVVAEIKSKFSSVKAVAVQLPVGSENSFRGVVDLVGMRLLEFGGPDGAEATSSEIPADLAAPAKAARDELVAAVADFSDELADLYLDGKDVPDELLAAAIRRQVVANRLCPVFAGAARRNIGAQAVLDAVADYLPSPLDVPEFSGHSPKGEEVKANIADEAFCGLVFKLVASGSADLVYLRVYSGVLKPDLAVVNSRTKERLKVKHILRLFAKNVEAIPAAGPGDIVGLLGLKDTTTGDTLHAVNRPLALEGVAFPEPVISIAVEPKSSKDKDKLAETLELLCREDPTLRLKKHESTGQSLLSGMGELHLEVNCHRLKNEFHLDARYGAPQVVFRETIKAGGDYSGVFDRLIGDRQFYAEVDFSLAPAPRLKEGITVKEAVKGKASLPNAWVAAAVEALDNGLRTGGNWGYPLIYIAATVTAIRGSAEKTVESSVAGAVMEGLRQAIQAGTELLEPLARLEILAPEASIGEITGYLQARRAVIHSIDNLPDIRRLVCEVPLAEMFGFSKALPKLSGGRASFSMIPFGYQPISPADLERLNHRA